MNLKIVAAVHNTAGSDQDEVGVDDDRVRGARLPRERHVHLRRRR